METDGGGWTLFFNYVHTPGLQVNLSERFPNNLKTNSHMYLKDAGFSERDVKEVRFLCSENTNKKGKSFWHFKTNSNGLVQTALTGDQSYIKVFLYNKKKSDFLSNYIELQRPSTFKKKYNKAFDKSYLTEMNVIGKYRRGGFTHSPFGSSVYNAYWTVGGESKNRFECGSSHIINGMSDYTDPINNPNMVYTHHTVWFRGDPASNEEHRERIQINLNK